MSDSTGPVVPKPTLPHGWSCHLSKSVPGISYYFNRFTGAKTWDISELIPGHSDRPAQALVAGSAEQLIFVRDQQPRPAAPNTSQQSSGSHQIYRQQQPVQPPTHLRHPSLMQGHHQQPRRPRLAGPPLDTVAGSLSSEFLGDEMTSLGVAELEAMLAEKKRKLEEMARRQFSSVNCSADSSSVESGFVSLVGREEEGGVGKDMSDRQKELTERGGLYRDWGDGVTHGSKRVKIDFDNNVVKTDSDKVNCDELETGDIDEPVINDENDNIANQIEVKDENNIDSDSESHDNESLCGADPEELAALASLDKKFSVDRASNSSSAAALSVPQLSSSPPELLLWDNDCQFSPEPESNEEESSEG